jgi:glutaryl-CoA dehydrogenase
MYELERIDSGIRSIVSVQNALTIYPLKRFGSNHLQKIYLEGLQKGHITGCFALTEEGGGSDPSSITTTYSKKGNHYIVTGTKSWVTNAPFAQIAIVWAKDAKGKGISGFVIPTDTPGFNIYPIENKMSLRLSPTAHIELDKVAVPLTHKLTGTSSLSSPLSCLSQARYGICWGVLGALESVYEESLIFSKSRSSFGASLSSKQLIQEKLTNMVSKHTKGLLLSYQLSVLLNQGVSTNEQISLAKRENTRSALVSARTAREILAAQGITLSSNVIRHMLNLETVDTYEGTYDIHTLILGKSITGKSAF